ncbi:PilZ domain-containing protein [Sphingomonas montana]|uniref:PilZ domain-containing protein n=1 Tax=Sphingomonas montana TaxID=1843236 RepID=UPI00096C5AE6|nr:PilZ domain-containing protein [Sphingomonas montana]
MTAPATAESPTPRRAERVAVDFPVSLRRQGLQRFSVRLVDLSPEGFCTEVDDPPRVGTTLWLTLPGLAPMRAQVAWATGFRIGAQFETPMHPSVLQAVVDRHG